MVTVSRVRRVGGRGKGREPFGKKGACATTVSGLGGREGSWELKEIAAGGSVSSVCRQFFFEIYEPKKNTFDLATEESGRCASGTRKRVRNPPFIDNTQKTIESMLKQCDGSHPLDLYKVRERVTQHACAHAHHPLCTHKPTHTRGPYCKFPAFC
jgi:hypothetical protein